MGGSASFVVWAPLPAPKTAVLLRGRLNRVVFILLLGLWFVLSVLCCVWFAVIALLGPRAAL